MGNQKVKDLARSVVTNMKPYSPGKPIWEVQKELGINEVVKLASNENTLGASPKAKEAIVKYLSELHRYPDANTSQLREAIGSHYRIDAKQIIIGNGADELITLISETFLEKDDEIIVPYPTFSEYEFGASLMNAQVVRVPLTETFEIDTNAMINAISDKTKLVYLCSPNNPTGTYLNREVLDDFFGKLPKNVIVVFDGAYSDFATKDDYTNGIEYLKKGYSIIVIQTFSKIYGLAGLRIGYGISTAEIINCIHKVREPFNVNALAQIAGVASIKDVEHYNKSKKIIEDGREYLYRAFNQLGLSYIESMSNFILVEIGNNALSVYEKLLQHGIIVRYANIWGLPNHIRVTVGNEYENKAFITLLSTLIS